VDPTGTPAELKAASALERGEYLTHAADCEVCHTAKDGVPFAGVVWRSCCRSALCTRPTSLPISDTGIGNYSDADFLGAVP
jgi:hypothetical protein